jgi:topoisomerase-4 subunit A
MIAFLRIDEVIKVIREADEPKAELMAVFSLTEIQAEDILEIRLRQLARLEGIKIERELNDLREERNGLQELLANEGSRRRLVVKEIREDVKKYGDARRSLIEAAEKVTAARVEAMADEPVTVILSRNGFIRSRVGHGIDRAMLSWKDGDGELAVIETRTVHPVVLLDATGRAYTVRPLELPGGKGDGVPVSSLVELQSGKVIAMLSGPAETKILLATTAGVGFIGRLGDMVSRQKAGKAYMTVDEGASLLPPSTVPEGAAWIAALAEEPRLLLFPIDEMKEMSGGKGVILIALEDKEKLIAALATPDCVTVVGIGRGDKQIDHKVCTGSADNWVGKRARKGKVLPVKYKRVSGMH